MRRTVLLAAALAVLFPAIARPEEEPETKRRVVYVPEDQMEALVTKHGRGVVLDVSEYLDLWRLAKQHRTGPGANPAADAVILSGNLEGAVEGDAVRLAATYRVRVLAEGLVRVPFLLSGAAVGDVTADDVTALVSRDAKGEFLLLQGTGDHTVRMTLSRKVERKEEVRFFRLGVPPGAALALDLRIPEGTEPVEGTLGGTWRTEGGDGGTRVVAWLAPAASLSFAWRPRREEGERTAYLAAKGRTLHRVGPRLLQTVSLSEVSVHRRRVREMAFRLPADVLVTDVAAPDLAGWQVEDDGGRLRVVFGHDAGGVVPVVVRLERILDGPGEIALPEVRLEGAAGESGIVAVAFTGGVEGRIVRAEGYARVAVPAPAPQPQRNQRAGQRNRRAAPEPEEQIVLTGAAAAYRYWSAERGLSVKTEESVGRMSVEVTAMVRLSESVRTIQAGLTYRRKGGRIYRLTPSFPADYELLALEVKAPAAHTWERADDGTVTIDFPSGVDPEKEVTVTASLVLESEAWRDERWKEMVLPIPVPGPGPAEEVRGRLAVFADPGLEVHDRALTGLEPEPVERLGVSGARLGYGWREPGPRGELVVTRAEPKVTVAHVAVVAPGEKTARYAGFLHYTVKRAGVRRFRFVVPGGLGDRLRVDPQGGTEPSRTRRPDGSDLWEVTLPRKVMGDYWIALALEEEMPVEDGARTFVFPEVSVPPDDVEAERGWLAVESGDNMEVTVEAEGLREIGLGEMASVWPSGFSPSRGLLAAYQYSAHPFSLSLTAVRFEDLPVLAAFVKEAHLVSVVGGDGLVRTRATYDLLNTDRQSLRVVLPRSSVLWGAHVGGKPVKPFVKDGEARVPLKTSDGATAVRVVFVYETPGRSLGSSGDLDLVAPVLPDVTGAVATWQVWLPSGYRVTTATGVFGGGDPAPGDPWLYRAIGTFVDMFGVVGVSREAAGPDRMVTRFSHAPGNAQVMSTTESEVRRREAGLQEKAKSEEKRAAPPRPAKPQAPADRAPAEDMDAGAPPEAAPAPSGAVPMPPGAPAPEPPGDVARVPSGGAGFGFDDREEAGGRRAPPAPQRMGRKGALSLNIPLLSGGAGRSVRALGTGGAVRLSYEEPADRGALSWVLTALTALAGLLLAGVGRAEGGFRISPFVFVVVVLAAATFAPGWFGVTDPTLWDGIARGACLAAAFFLLRGLGRAILPARNGVAAAALVVLAAGLLAAPARADEKRPAPPAPAPAAAEQGDVVYVPYDPARLGDLDRAGRVFLPFDEFQRLWNAAHPDRPVTAPEEAPVPWLLTAAAWHGAVEEETVRLDLVTDLVVLEKGWVEVALPLAPAVVEQALVDGEPVRVLSRPGVHVLVLRGEGAHRLTLSLRVLLRAEGDRRILEMALPAVPRSRLEFELPLADAEVSLEGPVEPEVEGKKLTALLGPTGKLALSWRPKAETPRIEARAEAETRETLTVLEGRSVLRMRTDLSVVSGSIREASFSLDSAFELLSVAGPDVKTWTIRDGRLVVLLAREVKDRTTISLLAVRADGARERTVSVPGVAPLDVVRERGLIAVAVSPDLRPTVSALRNLDRITARAEDYGGLLAAGAELHSAYRFVLRPLGLTVATEPVKAEVTVELPALFLIEREWLRSRTAFFFHVRGDGTFEFAAHLPADLEVERVEGKGLDRWWRDGDTLWLSAAQPVRGDFKVEVWWRKPLDPAAERVEIPEIHAVGATRETGSILVAHAPGMSLTLVEDEGLVKQDIALYRSWAPLRPDEKNVYGYRHDGNEYSLVVARSYPEARVRPVTTTHLQVEDEAVVVDTHFAFAIENAGEDTFKVFVPEGEAKEPLLSAKRTRRVSWEDVVQDGRRGRMLTIVLQQPAIGFYDFHLTWEKKLDRSQGELRTGAATLTGLEPQGEHATSYVYLLNLSPGEVSWARPDGLTSADVTSFPFLPDEIKKSPHLVLESWTGRSAAWKLSVTLTIHSFADFPDALISTAELLTAIGRDGWTRNRVTYRVLNRSRQFLEISLPEGARLESVRVGGKAAKPGRREVGGETRVLVPLVRMQPGDISTEVELTWSRQLGRTGREISRAGTLVLDEPKVHGFEVEKTFYTVVVPEGYRYSFDGNMDPVEEAVQRAWKAQQVAEELERVVEVQSRGSLAQQERAANVFLENRARIVDELESLNDAKNLRRLDEVSRNKVARLARDIQTKLGDLEQTAAQGSVQLRKQRGAQTRAGGKRAVKQGAVKQEMERTAELAKELAETQKDATVRLKGKSNVQAQSWSANFADAARKNVVDFLGAEGRDEGKPGQTEGGGAEAEWRRAFEQLGQNAMPQSGRVTFGAGKGEVDRLALAVTLLQDDAKVEQRLKDQHDYLRIAAVAKAIDGRAEDLGEQIRRALADPALRGDANRMREFAAKVLKPWQEVRKKRGVPAHGGEDVISDAPFEGPGTNAAIGIGGGAGRGFTRGMVPGGQEAASFRDQGGGLVRGGASANLSYGPPAGGTFFRGRFAPATRAGLLSLPVTVPTQGRVYRFEKRNGGARVEVSAGEEAPGRGLAGFGLFALSMAILIALRIWRPDRRYRAFGPVVLGLVAVLLALAGAFPLALPAIVIAVVWLVIQKRRFAAARA